jgi:hypothetical protein
MLWKKLPFPGAKPQFLLIGNDITQVSSALYMSDSARSPPPHPFLINSWSPKGVSLELSKSILSAPIYAVLFSSSFALHFYGDVWSQ